MAARVDGKPLGRRGPSAVAAVELHCGELFDELLTSCRRGSNGDVVLVPSRDASQ